MELLNILAGPVLGIASSIIAIQVWAIKEAKKAGAREQREATRQQEIDAAHKKIREVVMPKVEALEKDVSELTIRAEARDSIVTEMRQDLKQLLSEIRQISIDVAGLKPQNGNRD